MLQLLVALPRVLTWMGRPLLVVQFPQWQPRKADGYVAGAPFVGRLKFAWVIVHAPVASSTDEHWVRLEFHSFC